MRLCDLVGGVRGQRNPGGFSREWDGRPQGVVTNGEVRVPSVIHQFDAPQSVVWVTPSSENGLPVEGDFATVLVEEDFAAGVAEDSN